MSVLRASQREVLRATHSIENQVSTEWIEMDAPVLGSHIGHFCGRLAVHRKVALSKTAQWVQDIR